MPVENTAENLLNYTLNKSNMSLLKILTGIGAWFKKVFIDHTQSAASVAVTITEYAKTFLNSGIAGLLENLADSVTGTQLPTEAATAVNNAIPKILAVELSIEGLPDNPQPADILAFEQRVLAAFNVTGDNSKLYTELAACRYASALFKLR